ncbi:hypothetical protein BpHYR1_034607 [Brachionus plicatilis]|uniref:Uncharacterized protein n=1 Tax=Brachionus plicatilis TaxID=10195 RepID=A0A3M7T093_BRAPC|nr:hypothetical protein BpHYR1_034607 [Brachionus plicatilis]
MSSKELTFEDEFQKRSKFQKFVQKLKKIKFNDIMNEIFSTKGLIIMIRESKMPYILILISKNEFFLI